VVGRSNSWWHNFSNFLIPVKGTVVPFTAPLPLTLYVHYPWCIQKCPYCDFNSHTLKTEVDETAYIDALLIQLERTLPLVWGRPIQAIFFGGGTPSLISEAGLQRFLTQVQMLLGFSLEIEITLEANPGTVDFEKFAGFRQAGVNRLSMGIQSFKDEKLQALGRIHSAAEAKQAVAAAKAAGFDNFNLDLMFALPNQSLAQAVADIEQAIELAPPHLSHYQLTLEPNTPFYRQPPPLPEMEEAWAMQAACQEKLAQAGYQQYEVSAYAKAGHECQHNLNYWQFGDYIGLGAGAHGKLTLPGEERVVRTQMPASPGGFVQMMHALAQTSPAEQKSAGRVMEVCAEDLVFEFMLNALRLHCSVDKVLFEQRTGLSWSAVAEQVQGLVAQGLMVETDTQFGLTPQGRNFLNDVVAVFL